MIFYFNVIIEATTRCHVATEGDDIFEDGSRLDINKKQLLSIFYGACTAFVVCAYTGVLVVIFECHA